MKIDYSSWSTRLLSIDNLKLDVKNPRFSYQSTKEMNQTEIVKYLVENHAVYVSKSHCNKWVFIE